MSNLPPPGGYVQPEQTASGLEATDNATTHPRLSTFGDAHNDPFSRVKLMLLMAYMLRCPDLTREAVESLPEGQLFGLRVSEGPAALLWNARRAIQGQCEAAPPLELVRIAALQAAEEEYTGSATEVAQADVEDICRYVQQQPEAMFADPSAGRALLREFLTERWLRYELYSVGNGQGEINWAALQDIHERIGRLDHAGRGPCASLLARWAAYETELMRYRGRDLLGIATRWPQFDRLTLGLRGVILLTSRPGIGKSSFFGHAVLGAVRHNQNVCAVYFSLEMDRETIEHRIHAHLAELPLPTVLSGSPELRGRDGGPFSEPYFTPADQAKLDRAREIIDEIGSRLMVLSRQDLGAIISVEAMRAQVNRFKRQTGCQNAVVVLDYLSLVDVPPEVSRSELEADKWRITQVRRIVEGTQTVAFPEGDALLVICESRKPGSGGGEWGEGMDDFMGSARLTYAAEMTLNFSSPSEDELKDHYGRLYPGRGKKEIVAALEEQAIAPTVLKVTKARGASKGEVFFEYWFHQYRFVEKRKLSTEEQQRLQEERKAEGRQAVHGQVKGFIVDALRDDREHGLSRSRIETAIGPRTKTIKGIKTIGYDLVACLSELVCNQTLEAFEGPNPNGGGKKHPRWRLIQDPEQPVARPTRREGSCQSTAKNIARRKVKKNVEG